VCPEAAEKLKLQFDNVEVTGTIPGKDLIGLMCRAPMIHKEIPVFPADFIDPAIGTGLVTSVPSDAPSDWDSLEAAKRNPDLVNVYHIPQEVIDATQPISIISIKGYGDFPAKDIIDKMKISEITDPAKFKEAMEEAKKIVYKDGYHMGRMKDICGEFAGMRVEEAKDKMKQAMIDSGEAELFRDLTLEVVCRCGRTVHIRRIDDQWFIKYGDEKLTEDTKAHAKTMNIYPNEFYENVQGTLDWFRERACARLGNWLGTKFPFDQKWTIEPIADSTLYPIYYTISLYANRGEIKVEQMTEAFFDYVILERGNIAEVSESTGIPMDLLDQIKLDVHYWYPLDINLGGKEHMTVHFPVFLMNHRGLLPDSMQPKGIIANWYVTGKNKDKISKSKGGAQPIPGAVAKYGADAMRLYYAHIASMHVDVEWDEDGVFTYKQKLEKIAMTIEDLIAEESDVPASAIDTWLLSRFNTHLNEIRTAMEKFDLRQMCTVVYYDMANDMRWYERRGGKNRETIVKALRIWINAMMPVTPHIAEELWHEAGFEGFVSEAQLPEAEETSAAAEYGEVFVQNVISDVNEIRKMAKGEITKAVIYTSPAWKIGIMKDALAMAEEGKLTPPDLIKKCMANEDLKKMGKDVSNFASKTAVDFKRGSLDSKRAIVNFDETQFLLSAKDFIAAEVGLEVQVFAADDADRYDPAGKAKVAAPGRTAIYLE
ncbi:MAG: class I tRNA ligase family protein, partial [archaeon]|nr:class I tRNA ligase family protein [archaeon]